MTVEEIGAKLNALDAWDVAMPCHWAVKPRGCAFPYFCSTMKGEVASVKVRFMMIEGWQTFHDFVRTRVDHDFGFYSLPMEFPHYELIVLQSGESKLFRHDPGYVPHETTDREKAFCVPMLWETYGVMLRLETDNSLPLRYAAQRAIFARVEAADGVWQDAPIEIPPARPHVEKVSFARQDIASAKDLPIRADEAIELDLRAIPGLMTREPRPRILYLLAAVNAKTGEVLFRDTTSVDPESGLRGIWEGMPPKVLKHFLERHAIPGEIRVASGRLFRLLHPLCMELPFKLSKVAELHGFQMTDFSR